MRISAMVIRILRQLRGDRRTLALMAIAPLFILTLIYFILNTSTYEPTVGVVNAPEKYIDRLYENNVIAIRCDAEAGSLLLADEEVIALVSMENNKLQVQLDGTQKTDATQTLRALEAAKAAYLSGLSSGAASIDRPDLATDVTYVHGSDDMETFDNFGAGMIGILVFFLVFLVSGISFLEERTSGTLERLLSTPIKRYEIVTGYVLGFGVVTVVQAMLISVYAIYVLKVMMVGSIWLVMLLALLAAISALTMGLLASTAAGSEFQFIQFIPIMILPQVFFSGLFTLDGFWQYLGYVMPVYYVADGLTTVMIKGGGLIEILPDVFMLIGFSLLFMFVNTMALKRHRRI